MLRALHIAGHSRLFEAVSRFPPTCRPGLSIGLTRICRVVATPRLRVSNRGSIISALRHWAKCLHASKCTTMLAIRCTRHPQEFHNKLRLPTVYRHARSVLGMHRRHRRGRSHRRRRRHRLGSRGQCRGACYKRSDEDKANEPSVHERGPSLKCLVESSALVLPRDSAPLTPGPAREGVQTSLRPAGIKKGWASSI